jgi:hypothetical protein
VGHALSGPLNTCSRLGISPSNLGCERLQVDRDEDGGYAFLENGWNRLER